MKPLVKVRFDSRFDFRLTTSDFRLPGLLARHVGIHFACSVPLCCAWPPVELASAARRALLPRAHRRPLRKPTQRRLSRQDRPTGCNLTGGRACVRRCYEAADARWSRWGDRGGGLQGMHHAPLQKAARCFRAGILPPQQCLCVAPLVTAPPAATLTCTFARLVRA